MAPFDPYLLCERDMEQYRCAGGAFMQAQHAVRIVMATFGETAEVRIQIPAETFANRH
jgi:hypothetical protein